MGLDRASRQLAFRRSLVLYAVMVICVAAQDVSVIRNFPAFVGIGCFIVALVTVVFHGIELPTSQASVNGLPFLTIGLFNTGCRIILYFPNLPRFRFGAWRSLAA